MFKRRGLFIFLLALLALAVRPCFVHAGDSANVLINEVMWRGSSISSADEWLELFNTSDEAISLNGWVLYDEAKTQPMLTLSGGEIPAHGFFLISNNSKDHQFSKGESILNIDPDFVDSAVSLSNSEFKISLRKPNGEIADIAGDAKEPFWGDFNGRIASMQRIKYDKSGEEKSAWHASMEHKNLDSSSTEYATPRSAGKLIYDLNLNTDRIRFGDDEDLVFSYDFFDPSNEFESAVVEISDSREQRSNKKSLPFGEKEFKFSQSVCYPNVKISFFDHNGLWLSQNFKISCYQLSNQIKLYEVLPHPKGKDWNKDGLLDSSDEWVELVNLSDYDVDLEGWKIADMSGKTFEFHSQKIAPQDFISFYKSDTGLSLNDSGEKLFLYNPEDKLADSIVIPSSTTKYDLSFAKWGDSWFWTTTPTPSAVNVISQPKTQKNPPFDDLTEAEGKTVDLSGEVCGVERNGFSVTVDSKPVFVLAANGGELPSVGDQVTLHGISHSGSRPYIVATSFKITKRASLPNTSLNNLLTSEAMINNEDITKIIKTKKIISLKIAPTTLAPMVLGSSSMRNPGSFNIISFLLYSSGVIFFLLTIQIYEFCCRK